MFTGIITHLGTVQERKDNSFYILSGQDLIEKLTSGSSIAINGACLTVKEKPKDKIFKVEVMPETLKRTMLGDLKRGELVNLELPMSAESLFAGHIVQGHVDGVGRIEEITPVKNSQLFKFSIAKELSKYVVEKGSIAVNGISLTVIDTQEAFFSVGIIPYTWEHTMLKHAEVEDRVNIEVDIVAKYIERLLPRSREIYNA